jgi:hypothetical protein
VLGYKTIGGVYLEGAFGGATIAVLADVASALLVLLVMAVPVLDGAD